ncbi:hypothetical protein, partial [Paraburkholderia domus]
VGFVSSSSGSLSPAIMTDSRPSFSTQRTVQIIGATSLRGRLNVGFAADSGPWSDDAIWRSFG